MKFLLLSVAVTLTAGQQFKQSLEFNPAVRLAGPGFFQQGSSFRSSSTTDNSNRNNQFQNRGSTVQFSSLSNNRNSESLVRFQNDNQFPSGRTSFQQSQQNIINSFDSNSQTRPQAQALQQNQQNTFSSTGAFQQDSGNQFQSTSSVITSQVNGGLRFDVNQGNSPSRPQTFTDNQQDSRRNRLTAINVQLTPSVRFQDQQVTGTSFQTNRNQQNADNRFQQTSFTGTRFENNINNNNNNNIQFSTNSQVSSRSQSQSSNRQQLNAASSLSQFTDEVNGVFEPLNLPSGATLLLGRISSSFSCADRPYGYYADQENSCRVFHICNPALFSDGKIETYQYSFMCGEGTVFDQDELTCKVEYDATPCQEAANFYFRNEQFGRLEDRNL
ncbi:probable protein phosphatase DDB_G0279461 [Macrobrachium rosenbergii]|uniref:probable protein phosphatase DDB_G0279461 n=1 Tax=Macrobrachium rosenbergii TaxID=79674 RepID=UPI0034D5DF6B